MVALQFANFFKDVRLERRAGVLSCLINEFFNPVRLVY